MNPSKWPFKMRSPIGDGALLGLSGARTARVVALLALFSLDAGLARETGGDVAMVEGGGVEGRGGDPVRSKPLG